MANAIAWILKTLLRLLLPPSGRHRAERAARRRTLWLAVYGIDIGPCVIHGVRVVA
ncbi:hypothetical protein AB0H07_25845 [Streptomyces sp. NPDC021354]|uniref:hypothetical protein n=1 Tax=Streptomyces sp. NPDC021354 TaxID=3154793 RepID=UPI0033C290DA